MSGKPTIKDISLRTGLAVGTISKYLNNGNVKQQNINQIKQAIEELGYNVDSYARGMVTKKTNSVGIVIPELGNTFYGLIASLIGKILHSQHYEIIVKESNLVPEIERDCLQWFIDKRTDAIICFSCLNSPDFYNKLNYPTLIFVDSFIDSVNADFVLVDNYEIVKKSTEYLFEMGHRRIAGIFPRNNYTAVQRKKGFIDAFAEAKIPMDDDLIFDIEDTIDDACAAVNRILALQKHTLIFSANYLSTLGTIFVVNEKSLAIPQDISLMGFDNIMLTKLFTPTLSIVNQPIEEMAAVTAERALQVIRDNGTKKETVFLKCSLMKGQTVRNLTQK